MLQTIRDKITGWVATIFLGAIAVVFVFWGIDFQSTVAGYAAKVDGESISAESVRQAWQQQHSQLQQMLRDELPPEMVKAQQAALLDRFVRQSLLTQRANEFGYRVDDQALMRRLTEFPEFQVDGKFSADRYAMVLRQNGLSTPQFEADLQTQLLVSQVQNGIVDSGFATPHELQRRYALEKQEREVDYALIAASDFAASTTITDEQVQQWYEQRKDQYMTEETVDLQYVELTRARAEAAVTMTEEALKEYYEQVKQRFESPERRRGRHILITVEDGVDDASAQKKAADLTASAQGGADFTQLAKVNSKDPGSAAQGGDLGWAQRGMFVGPFEDALFEMKVGEIRGPVKTQFGYHVLKLEEVETGHLRSFEEVRAELEAEFRKERSQSLFYDETQKLADAAFSSLTELGSVSKTMNLPLKTVAGFTRAGGGELGNDPNAIQAAFSEDVLERGQNSPLVAIGEDRAVILRATKHKPAEPRPLAEVRPQIEAQLKNDAIRAAATRKGEEAVERLEKGESWPAVAAALGLKPVGKRFVTRTDSVATPAVVRAAFNIPQTQIAADKPHYVGATTDDGNYAVLAVTQVRNGDPAVEPEKERTDRRRRLERQVGNEEFTAYLTDAELNAEIVKNPQVFD
jgi:peptidyl-prolyl cis-trans isomerase D